MRALTIHQPWATLIALGHKTVENRSRPFSYRGPLAIHAGKEIWTEGYSLAKRLGIELPPPFEIPTGKILAVTDLWDCLEYDYEDGHPLDEDIFACGPFCLRLRHTIQLSKPIPFRGQQGLFFVPDKLIEFPESEVL